MTIWIPGAHSLLATGNMISCKPGDCPQTYPFLFPKTNFPFLVHRVIAFDPDTGDNADISYSIVDGKGNGRFKIYPKTGMIYSQKEFVEGQSFNLIVSRIGSKFPYLDTHFPIFSIHILQKMMKSVLLLPGVIFETIYKGLLSSIYLIKIK